MQFRSWLFLLLDGQLEGAECRPRVGDPVADRMSQIDVVFTGGPADGHAAQDEHRLHYA